LQRGAAGWILLAGLGVAYVISGMFAGWNFGLAEGGWGGLLIATALMGTMYTAMVFTLAELSAALPVAGAGYAFARRAMGVWGGFLTGTAIVIECAIAPAAIVTFIAAYIQSLTGFGGSGVSAFVVYLVFYGVFVGLFLYGVGEALKVMFVITALAIAAIVVFVIGMVPQFDPSNLLDINTTGAVGASSFLPFGLVGIWAAFPYAIWFFLGIEALPLAAEETRDPVRDMPKGLIAAMLTLLIFAALILLFAASGAGSAAIQKAGAPLTAAITAPSAYGGKNVLYTFVNIAGLAGLIASFYSLIYAYSRQIFALSRVGYIPRWLSVFGATISYVLMMLSHLVLRYKEPELERPYKTPGGVLTSGVALVLGVAAVIAGFLVDPRVLIGTAIVYAIMIAYFAFYSRHHLVAQAPEEEFGALEKAEAELAGS
jgi:ethanolamine permease